MALKGIIISSFCVLFVAVLFAFLNLRQPTYHEKDLNSVQDELQPEKMTNVLDDQGKLSMIGWGRSSEKFLFDPSKINPSTSQFSFLNKFRYKKWEAFVIVHEDFIIGTAIFDVSYAGGYFVHYSNMSDDSAIKAIEHVDLFNKPQVQDDCSRECITKYKIDDYLNYDQRTLGNSDFLSFKLNTTDIQLDIDLKYKKNLSDNLVTLNPISEDSTLFYYNSKRYLLPAIGKIVINGKTYSNSKIYIANDSGRGVWPLRSGWIWVSATGKTNKGESIALNLGHGFNHPNASRHTEDSFFINGKLFKLEAVKTEKGLDKNGKEEWIFISKVSDKIKNKCEIRFRPLKIKNGLMDNQFVKKFIKFDLRYGVYSGKCLTETGEVHEFDSVNGMLEDKLSLW